MTEGTMEDSKLIQIFLSQGSSLGIYEVSLTKDKVFICTCPGYAARVLCKHVNFVKSRTKNNDGYYPLALSDRCKDEDADEALKSSESFREFIIKFGKIEVC
jgi:hypothetical protein